MWKLRINQHKKKDYITSHTYIWNTIAGIVNASQSVIILMVVSRTNGIESAGILTIGFALANLFMAIGKFGMRNFQVTDVRREYSFITYFSSRIVSVLFMVLISLSYLIIKYYAGEYSLEKSLSIFLVCMLYVVEAFEDSFIGEYQRKGRLDIGAMIFSLRWIIVIFIICLFLVFTHNVILSLSVSLLISLLSFSFFIISFNRILNLGEVRFSLKKVFQLFKKCTPLAISGFCAFYFINAPKYAIDTYLNDTLQAYYGFIVMPVFVIGLLNSFLYTPTIVEIAKEYKDKKYTKLKKRIIMQMIFISLITFICVVGAFFLGIPVLSLLYNTNLENYKEELLILLTGSSFFAISGYLGIILIVMRLQHQMMYCYLLVALFAKLFSGFFILKWQIKGAVFISCSLMVLISFLFFLLILHNEQRNIKDNNKQLTY